MSITVEEMNLISIYHEDTRAGFWTRPGALWPTCKDWRRAKR